MRNLKGIVQQSGKTGHRGGKDVRIETGEAG